MTTIVWPASLPKYVLISNYEETAPKTGVSTKMDVGPTKRRRRATAAERKFSVRVALQDAQVEVLDDFFLTTLAGGALPFEWVHPRTQLTATFAFTECKPPKYRPADGGAKWYADMELDLLP